MAYTDLQNSVTERETIKRTQKLVVCPRPLTFISTNEF